MGYIHLSRKCLLSSFSVLDTVPRGRGGQGSREQSPVPSGAPAVGGDRHTPPVRRPSWKEGEGHTDAQVSALPAWGFWKRLALGQWTESRDPPSPTWQTSCRPLGAQGNLALCPKAVEPEAPMPGGRKRWVSQVKKREQESVLTDTPRTNVSPEH